MKTRNIIIAIIAVIGAVATIILFGTNTFGVLSGVNVAVIIGIGGLFAGGILDQINDKRQGFVVKDERSTLLQGKASRLGFIVGNYVWLALLWYEFLADKWLPTDPIGSPAILLIGLLLQIGIYFAGMFYYRNKV